MISVLPFPASFLLLVAAVGYFFMTLGSSSADFTQFVVYYVPAIIIAFALKTPLVTFFWKNRLSRSTIISLASTLTFVFVSGCILPFLYILDLFLYSGSLPIGKPVLVIIAALIGLLSEWAVAFFFKKEYPQYLGLIAILLIGDIMPFIAFYTCWIIYFGRAANFPAIQM